MNTTLTTRKIILSIAVLLIVSLTSITFHYTQGPYKNFIQGVRLFKQGKFQQALELLEPTFLSQPDNLNLGMILVWNYKELDKMQKMREMMDYIWEADTRDPEIARQLADAYSSQSEFGRAEVLYRKAYSQLKTPSSKMGLAQNLVWQKKYKEAIPLLEELLSQSPQEAELLEFYGNVCFWANKHEKAIEIYKTLLSLNLGSEEVVLKLADLLRYTGRDEEAIQIYNQYLKNKE